MSQTLLGSLPNESERMKDNVDLIVHFQTGLVRRGSLAYSKLPFRFDSSDPGHATLFPSLPPSLPTTLVLAAFTMIVMMIMMMMMMDIAFHLSNIKCSVTIRGVPRVAHPVSQHHGLEEDQPIDEEREREV